MKTATTPQAIVIGCGIGGPVVAMALQRAGIDATIYEAFDRPADAVGSFLNLASNGIDALRAIGADRSVLESAFPTLRMVMWSGSGRRLGEVANGIALADGTASQTIARGALHRALREEAIHRGIAVIGGKSLVAVDRTPNGAIARFADGTHPSAGLLIGADGLHSVTRRLIDPAAPAPRYTGLLSIGGRAYCPALPPTPETFHMVFGRRAFFGYTVRPSGEVYWFANVASALPTRDARSRSSAWTDRLIELFAGDAGPAIDIVSASTGTLTTHAIFDMPTVPSWRSGSAVLVGDAAHATSPNSGQGASLAIEDAVVLAKCLRDVRGIETALAMYEHLRRERVERVVRYSARVGRTKSPGPLGRWLRDLCMPLALKVFAARDSQAWLYRHHIDWEERVAAATRTAAA